MRITHTHIRITFLSIFCAVVLGAGAVIYLSIAPSSFPTGKTVTISKGMYMSQAADLLKKDGIIRSKTLFKIYVMFLSGRRAVQAGDYLFTSPQSALRVAFRTVWGIEDIPQVKVTLYEGMDSSEMASAIKKAIPNFDTQTFLVLAKPLEGQLFPDTYYLYKNVTPQSVIDLLHSTFTEKTKPLLLQTQILGKTPEQVLTMASLVEKEATSTVDRELIAGILWKRLDQNMPLQVDVPFYYLLGKDSAELTKSDLALDSPYNLYKHTGLPPIPVDNPGLDAIQATLNPIPSKFLYFLAGKDGQIHYAATLDGHITNRQKYLE